MTREQFLVALHEGGVIIQQVASVASAAGLPVAGAVSMGLKIALGVSDQVPEALTLWDQFRDSKMPSQDDLDAYAADEDSAYANLMADVHAAKNK